MRTFLLLIAGVAVGIILARVIQPKQKGVLVESEITAEYISCPLPATDEPVKVSIYRGYGGTTNWHREWEYTDQSRRVMVLTWGKPYRNLRVMGTDE